MIGNIQVKSGKSAGHGAQLREHLDSFYNWFKEH